MIQILHGDCREVLRTLPDQSVHCCITSPPYFQLRSYLPADHPDKHLEIGSEPTVEQWVDTMVQVFREVKRVLRDDGTLWLNLGDSYAGSRCGDHTNAPGLRNPGQKIDNSAEAKVLQRTRQSTDSRRRDRVEIPRSDVRMPGYKPKDLIGQPWMLAFALRADGWFLRQEIIWAKRSPMPESVRDRFTKAHETVFLLSKQPRYFFDLDAVQEEASEGTHARLAQNVEAQAGSFGAHAGVGRGGRPMKAMKGRLLPPKAALATSGNDGAYADGKSERMGRGAGWREQGVGRREGPPGNPAECRVRQGNGVGFGHGTDAAERGRGRVKNNDSFDEAMAVIPSTRNPRSVRWLASEPFKGAHYATYPPELIRPFVLAGCPPGGTVLDPFGGSGTTGLVADQEGRNAILIDLDERNLPMARQRITADAPLFAEVDLRYTG